MEWEAYFLDIIASISYLLSFGKLSPRSQLLFSLSHQATVPSVILNTLPSCILTLERFIMEKLDL